jgi:D-amino-acid dehydrogenase
MHVCVLGAGIVGLATAYALNRQGLQVTVIDRATPGTGASGGNGAQLSYSYVQPLADPSVWRQLPKLLLSSNSPLKIKPQWDFLQWSWGVAFMRACNARTSASSTAHLLQLAAQSRMGFESMLADTQIGCNSSRTGKLVIYDNLPAFTAACKQMRLQAQMGCEQEAVTAKRCVEIEPALAHHQKNIVGAIYTSSECTADCLKVCEGLHQFLQQRGVQFLLGHELHGFVADGSRIQEVKTQKNTIQADQFVLSLGGASHALARLLKLWLPIYPIKGYSITLQLKDQTRAAPSVSVTDANRKVVFARLGSRLRVAGMAELVGHDMHIPTSRINSLRHTTQTLFPDCSDFQQLQPWTGMRPATPTGLPLIGRHAKGPDNLLMNTGHGALGFTLAFGSAQALVQQLIQSSKQQFAVSLPSREVLP